MDYELYNMNEFMNDIEVPQEINKDNWNNLFYLDYAGNFMSHNSYKGFKKMMEDYNAPNYLSQEIVAFYSMYLHIKNNENSDLDNELDNDFENVIKESLCPELWFNRKCDLHLETADNYHEERILEIFKEYKLSVETWKRLIWVHIYLFVSKRTKIEHNLYYDLKAAFLEKINNSIIETCPYCSEDVEFFDDGEINSDSCYHFDNRDGQYDNIKEEIKNAVGRDGYNNLIDLGLYDDIAEYISDNYIVSECCENNDYCFYDLEISESTVLSIIEDNLDSYIDNLDFVTDIDVQSLKDDHVSDVESFIKFAIFLHNIDYSVQVHDSELLNMIVNRCFKYHCFSLQTLEDRGLWISEDLYWLFNDSEE